MGEGGYLNVERGGGGGGDREGRARQKLGMPFK